MEIHKIELNLGQKSVNPFKTTRKSNTNPFKYQDFEGNTIDPLICADVLVSFKGKENKLKMIASSVVGSMTKLRNGITEPIINFVNRIKDVITGAWTYAKNTEVNLSGLKNISDDINNVLNYDVGKGISDSITGIGKHLTDKVSLLNKDLTGLGHGISDKWTNLIGKIGIRNIGHTKITSDLPVEQLKGLWLRENAVIAEQKAKEIAMNTAKEIDINTKKSMEVKVA